VSKKAFRLVSVFLLPGLYFTFVRCVHVASCRHSRKVQIHFDSILW